MKRSKLVKSALASCLAAGINLNLYGANYNWVGGDGDFGNSIHWSPNGGPPAAGDTGTISALANIDVSFSSDFLGANSPAAINLGNHVIFDTFAHQFNVDGPFTFTGTDSLLTVRPVLADPTKFGFESNQLNINGGNTMRLLGAKAKTTTFSLSQGTIWLDGGATLQGSNSLSFIGNSSGSDDARLNVFNGGVSTIDGQVQFNHDAFVDVFSNTTLRLARNVTLNGGGTFQGGGTLQFDGAETLVIADTDITMPAGRVDLDGGGGVLSAGQKWIVQGALNIHAEGIDIDDNVFGNHNLIGEDTIEIRNMGTLNIQLTDPKLAWTMAGHLDINAPDASFGTDTSIAGSTIIMTGTTDVSGSSQWTARADLVGDTTVQANADLHLLGGTLGVPNTLQGGSIVGAGTLATTAGHGLVGHGTIGTKIAFASLSQLMADDGPLTITPNAQLVQLGTIGTRNSTGILDVQFDWNTDAAAQSLELRGGSVTGGVITNGGETRGNGQITTAGFINRGALIPQLATLTIDTTNNPDLDGSFNGLSGAGTIDATAGSLIVKKSLTDGFNSTLTVGPGQFVTFEQGWSLDRGSAFAGFGVLNLNGGANVLNRARISGGPQVLNGIVNVDLETAFEAATTFGSTVQVNLPGASDKLRVFEDSIIQKGAQFAGNGGLVNVASTNMVLQGGAEVGVNLSNAGTLIVADPVQDALVESYNSTSLATLQLDIFGKVGTQFDTLHINQTAALDGRLDLSTNKVGSTYVDPSVRGTSDTFSLITTKGGVSGHFQNVVYNGSTLVPTFVAPDGSIRAHVGNGLFREVNYAAKTVTLVNYLASIGDLNGDGSVDALDAGQMFANWASSTTDWSAGDLNGDGIVDAADAGEMFEHWTGDSAPASMVPEPTSWGSLSLLGLLLTRLRRSRK